eukprot:gnl/TRDRNA2_/TRDRNA2_149885_c3_seq1.p1 gnl/TRDRNA2_/TRDRNA2_149885_c3~~gnl/TRDRNA2_/TRDRNA2_149885_c3_seq1.p1  ORF type:complete len:818 (-),score=224.19 gnl/TRDRNA2_/TRDRNA2_149885_c3_seq1:126-2384(-)
MSKAALEAEYKKMGMPFDSRLDQQGLVDRLRDVLIWADLPLAELRKECEAHDVSVHVVGELKERELVMELIKRLVLSTWSESWLARGINAPGRLGSLELANTLIQEVDRLQSMSTAGLRDEYVKSVAPFDTNNKMEKQMLVDRLRKVLVWEQLPLEELQQESQDLGLTVVKPSRSPKVSAVDACSTMITNLIEHMCLLDWEAKGVPVLRLNNFERASQLNQQYDDIDNMSLEEIKEWYKTTGFPEEKDMEKSEFVKLLKAVTAWESCPLVELQKESRERKVPIPRAGHGSEEEQREKIMDRLFIQTRMDIWDEKGLQAHRIGGSDKFIPLITQHAAWQNLSRAELEKIYVEAGLPEEAGQVSLEREELLRRLWSLLVWEVLPISELVKDCEARNLPTKPSRSGAAGEDERRFELVERLLEDMAKDTDRAQRSSFEKQGIPVARLGSFQAARDVAEELDRLRAMSSEQLREEHDEIGMPVTSSMSKEFLFDRMKDVIIRRALPLEELRAECQKSGISLGTLSPDTDAEELQEQLRDMLMLDACKSTFEDLTIPVNQLGSFRACANVARDWMAVDAMGDADLKERCSDLGVFEAGLAREQMSERLKNEALWMEIPLQDLQELCRKAQVNTTGKHGRSALIQKLLWAQQSAPPSPDKPQSDAEPDAEPRTPSPAPLARQVEGEKPKQVESGLSEHLATLKLPGTAGFEDVKTAYRVFVQKFAQEGRSETKEGSQELRKVRDAYKALTEHFRKQGC